MTSDQQSRRLAEHLQSLIEGLENADRQNPALDKDLSPQELKVLRTVGRCECPIMSAIASAIRLSLSSVTGLIDRLCEKKLVRRDRSAEDRRIVQVELTEEGKKLHEAAFHGRLAFARDLLKPLNGDEQERLVSLLGKAAEGLRPRGV